MADEREQVEQQIEKYRMYIEKHIGTDARFSKIYHKYFDMKYDKKGNLISVKEKQDVVERELKLCGYFCIMKQWYIEDQKKYEEAPELGKVLDALLKQLGLLTDGAYDRYYEDCRIRHAGLNDENSHRSFDLPYQMRMQDIFWHILDLKEGRYHGSGNLKYEGRRGIPRIETVGERIYTALLDLIWRMDNGEGYIEPEEAEARQRDAERMSKIIPQVND